MIMELTGKVVRYTNKGQMSIPIVIYYMDYKTLLAQIEKVEKEPTFESWKTSDINALNNILIKFKLEEFLQ